MVHTVVHTIIWPHSFLDEVSCALFEPDASYIKTSAPKEKGVNKTKAVNSQRVKVSVQVDVNVLSILEISEVDGYISLQLVLSLTW